MATKPQLVEMAVGAGLGEKAAKAMTKAQIETYLASGSAPAEAPVGKGTKDIVRTNAHAWWCPFCDNSNHFNVSACGKCGAAKDGATATL